MLFTKKILQWYDRHGRHDLPWQRNPTSYKIWLSEIMLQQTQVTSVIPYFLRFIEQFPTLKSLANASIDAILAQWAGLGYYARARNLHKAAQIILSKYQGKFPTDFDQLIDLPGIGRSTAGAILAFTTQKRFPILDGNVKRVLSRYFAIKTDSADKKTLEVLWSLSAQCTPSKRVDHYTQAIMDFGATLCTRHKPKCSLCPVKVTCQAFKEDKVLHYPIRHKQSLSKIKPIRDIQMALVIHKKEKKILLEKRAASGIWGGLWSLPECAMDQNIKNWAKKQFNQIVFTSHFLTTQDFGNNKNNGNHSIGSPIHNFGAQDYIQKKIKIHKNQSWKSFRHTFTHYHLNIYPHIFEVDFIQNKTKAKKAQSREHSSNLTPAVYQWYDYKNALSLGLPAPIKKMINAL